MKKTNRPTKRFKPSFTYQTSATGKGAKAPDPTKEERAAKAKKLAEWNPAQARKYERSFKDHVEKLLKAEPATKKPEPLDEGKTTGPVEDRFEPQVDTVKPKKAEPDEKDRAVPSGRGMKQSNNPADDYHLVNYNENMNRMVAEGRYRDLIDQGMDTLPPTRSLSKAVKVSTTQLLDILKKKPPIANRKFKGNFAGQTPDWSQKNPTQERDVESWAEERGRRGENKESGMDNGLDGSLRANKNNLKGAPKLQGIDSINKEGNGTGEGAGAGVATGSGGLAGGGTAHVSTNSGIFTTTYGGDRGKKKAGQTQKDHDVATMSFNKRGTDVSSDTKIVEKGRVQLDKALAPIYNRDVKMRQGGEAIAPVDQKKPKPVERQVSHKGNKRANTWKNP